MSAAHMTVKKLAERWDCNVSVIYHQINQGNIAALQIGTAVRIPIAAVEAFEANNTKNAKSA